MEDLTLVSGGRFSWFESRYTTQAARWDDVSTAKASAEFTPMVGLVYALTPQWSAYASYADIFEPQTATTLDGSILKPIVGANYEVGVKGELMRGLQVAAGYTFNSNKYLSDPDREGQTFSEETPRHLLRLWSEYRLPGQLNRLSVGAGVNWQSALTNSISKVRRPSYSVWNTRVAYDVTSNWTAALNVNNLFDKVYYEYPGYVENRNNYGAPRSVTLTLRGRF